MRETLVFLETKLCFLINCFLKSSFIYSGGQKLLNLVLFSTLIFCGLIHRFVWIIPQLDVISYFDLILFIVSGVSILGLSCVEMGLMFIKNIFQFGFLKKKYST